MRFIFVAVTFVVHYLQGKITSRGDLPSKTIFISAGGSAHFGLPGGAFNPGELVEGKKAGGQMFITKPDSMRDLKKVLSYVVSDDWKYSR